MEPAAEVPVLGRGDYAAVEGSAPRRVWLRRFGLVAVVGGLALLGVAGVVGRSQPMAVAGEHPGAAEQLYGGASVTLFCWCVAREGTYEMDILRAQAANGAGIFQCEGQQVFSERPLSLAPGVETLGLGSLNTAHGGSGPLATASWVNADAFLRAWAILHATGRHSFADWVAKVDPDTVLVPSVLRQHLVQRGLYGPVNLYVLNCLGVENGLYGSIELMSRQGATRFLENMDRCRQSLPYAAGWGEDLFAQKCMDSSGVGHQEDPDVIADGNCNGVAPSCAPGTPAFHPLKSEAAWMQCWAQAAQGGAEQRQVLPEQRQVLRGGAWSSGTRPFPTQMVVRQGGSGGGGPWGGWSLPTFHRL